MMADIMPSKVIQVLNNLKGESGRFEKLTSKQGFSIINDAYNANPQSMIGSLETLATSRCSGKRIAFLGDMLELGDYTQKAHEEVGLAVANNKIDILISVGKFSKDIAKAAEKNGISPDNIF
ncbi:MAG: cyanophycin synthetase [Coriobacteriia bacterium]|nr:cyanophycin synthetase [Coriobacteriia bacterium]